MILHEDDVGREPCSPDECTPVAELVGFLRERGYDAWLEPVDDGVILHGVVLSKDEGGEDILVPESWAR